MISAIINSMLVAEIGRQAIGLPPRKGEVLGRALTNYLRDKDLKKYQSATEGLGEPDFRKLVGLPSKAKK